MSSVTGGAPTLDPDDMWVQIARITFRFLFAVICVVAIGWAFSNVRQIPADSRAIVLRFGAIIGERGPGLLMAWPRPFEEVVMLPAHDRQLELPVDKELATVPPNVALLDAEVGFDARRNAEFLLTGDSGVVRLRATLFYQITDAPAYVLAAEQVAPALRRLFTASAVAVCAGRDLDAIIMARTPVDTDVDHVLRSQQERFRSDLVAAVNRRLAALAAQGAGLGVTVSRIDLTASLPTAAKEAFDQVLTSTQKADRDLAEARADTSRITQTANQERDRILAEADALAVERRTEARARTASIAAINPHYGGEAQAALINRIYYERVGALLKKAARIDAIDPHSSGQLYLPGRPE
jgi:regulator of protease activity HflC (stomatin/prohibitin superfamily)